MVPNQVFVDNYNPAGYILFLLSNNPHFTQALQLDYYQRIAQSGVKRRVPDFAVHYPAERVFYEVKPDSVAGLAAGAVWTVVDIIRLSDELWREAAVLAREEVT